MHESDLVTLAIKPLIIPNMSTLHMSTCTKNKLLIYGKLCRRMTRGKLLLQKSQFMRRNILNQFVGLFGSTEIVKLIGIEILFLPNRDKK